MDISPNQGPRLCYKVITPEQLFFEVGEVLNNLPDAEETLAIGQLCSRSIYVQRRLVRDAIMTVDPGGTASRRTLSIFPRT